MNMKCLLFAAACLLADPVSVVAAFSPSLEPVQPTVEVRRGYNATLVCMGRNIEPWDSFLFWKFNGTDIKGGNKRNVAEKYFPRGKVNFTLLVTNVSQKDVGQYICEAFSSNFGGTDVSRAVIELKLRRKTRWPKGTYSLPMTRSGCPDSSGFSWLEGSLSQDTEDTRPVSHWSHPLHLKGKMKQDAIRQQFCVKQSDLGDADWPEGNYCIYKKNTCPPGFSDGGIKWDDEDTKNDNSVSGVLPDGNYDADTTVHFCCRSDGSAESPIHLPTSKPFFLFKHSARCQAVKGMRVIEEWIFWDCEDEENSNKRFGTTPAAAFVKKDIKLIYCYYFKK